jgi:hypothetical protein
MNCPICNKEVGAYYESSHKEPFAHTDPFIGMAIYGPYSSEKHILCQNDEFVHFVFAGRVEETSRLVKLGVKNSITEQEMMADMEEDIDDSIYDDLDDWEFEHVDDEEDDFEECPDCDGHDACRDFGCAFKHNLGHMVNENELDDLPF